MENSDLSDMDTNVEPPVEADVCYNRQHFKFCKKIKKEKAIQKKRKSCECISRNPLFILTWHLLHLQVHK